MNRDTPVDPYAAEAAPRNDPMSYPGAWPNASVVITATSLWELRDRDGASLRWQDTPPVRVGACRVRKPDESGNPAEPQLNRVAETARSVPVDSRVPVISVGSNAAPAQLRAKFSDQPERLFVLSIRARVSGVAVGYTPFAASFGYIPATPFAAADEVSTLAVQFIDPHQLKTIDATEAPHYRRVWLSADDGIGILLETGERLAGAYAYVANSGLLTDPAGEPYRVRLPGSGNATGSGLTQTELHTALKADAAIVAHLDSPEQISSDVDALTAAIEASERVRLGDPLRALPDQIGNAPMVYGDMVAHDRSHTGLDVPAGQHVAWVGRSPDGLNRGGKSVIRISRTQHERLGSPDQVVIRSAALVSAHGEAAPAAIAAVHPWSAAEPPEPADGIAQVDHVLRMACGLERGDAMLMQPVSVDRVHWVDEILGAPTYLTMRVTLADPASTERDIVLMNRLAIDVLGVSGGDYVVLEGMPDETGTAYSVVVKVFEVPGEVEENRRRITGGVWGARFPAAEATLGVEPDLPLAFVDGELRARLGIHGQTLATVRARPGRLHQFFVELREMMLVLAVAFVGIVVSVPSLWIQIVLLVALFGLTFALVIGRMRRRFSHRSKKRHTPRRASFRHGAQNLAE